MTSKMSRRTLLTSSLLMASAPAMALDRSFWQILQSSDAIEQIKGILQENFELPNLSPGFLSDFYRSLLLGLSHTESGSEFVRMRMHADEELSFARYIVQEFVSSTNYYSWAEGEDAELCVIE